MTGDVVELTAQPIQGRCPNMKYTSAGLQLKKSSRSLFCALSFCSKGRQERQEFKNHQVLFHLRFALNISGTYAATRAGEAIVAGVVGDMVGRVISLLAGQLRDQRSVQEKLRRVRRLLIRIESVVEAADARHITSRSLFVWLSELLDGAHQGRYLLDACPSGALELPGDEDGGVHGDVAWSFSLPNSFNPAKRLRVAARRMLFGGDSSGELGGVLANLESASGGLAEFIMLLQSCPPALHRPLTTNIHADSQMFGRHIDFLLQDDHDEPAAAELGVLPIIGSAGLGKTTLVQHVCNEPAVRRRFSLIMMLDFHCMSLMAAGETELLIRSLFTVSDTPSTGLSLSGGENPLRLLERKLRGERFLVVFDNVDACRKQVVDAIMPALRRGGRRGSKIIVTSRDAANVAGLGTVEAITLLPLPPQEYWFFFKAHAFGGADAEADPRLAAAGQAIAKRLRGSFFGGKIVGGLLRSRPVPRLWREVLRGSAGEMPCIYVAAAARALLPPHVTVRSVTVSVSPVRGLVGLQDSSLTAPPPTDDGGHRRPELPVLLCKSVFPSYCLYYTAHCAIDIR